MTWPDSFCFVFQILMAIRRRAIDWLVDAQSVSKQHIFPMREFETMPIFPMKRHANVPASKWCKMIYSAESSCNFPPASIESDARRCEILLPDKWPPDKTFKQLSFLFFISLFLLLHVIVCRICLFKKIYISLGLRRWYETTTPTPPTPTVSWPTLFIKVARAMIYSAALKLTTCSRWKSERDPTIRINRWQLNSCAEVNHFIDSLSTDLILNNQNDYCFISRKQK